MLSIGTPDDHAPASGAARGPAGCPPAPRESGLVALEFALIAPIFVTMIMGGYDLSQAIICWQKTQTAAQNIAEAAANLAAVSNSSTNTSTAYSDLSPTVAENAMTLIYGVLPYLASTSYGGTYSVTLSGVQFAGTGGSSPSGANAYVTWSAPMTEGTSAMATVRRSCGETAQSATYLESAATLTSIPTGTLTTPSPLVIADVHVQYRATFFRFIGNVDYWETYVQEPITGSAVAPNQQIITYNNNTQGATNVCSPPPSS